MSVETEMCAALLADEDVNAKVANRIRPGVAEDDDANPLIVYRQIGGSKIVTSDEVLDEGPRRYQVDFVADTFDEARELADLVEPLLMELGWAQTSSTDTQAAGQNDAVDYVTRREYSVWA